MLGSGQTGAARRLDFQTDFTAEELAARRAAVMAAMGTGAALIQGAPQPPGFDPIRQTNDFYYLTGVEVPHACLRMEAGEGASTLYLPPRDEKLEKTDGPQLGAEDGEFVRARTGIELVKPLAALPDDVRSLRRIYLPRATAEGIRQCQDTLRTMQRWVDADPLNGRPSAEMHFLSRVVVVAPTAELLDLSPIVHRLRVIKSAAEVGLMRRAGRLTALACVEAMRSTRPGVYEYQLAAVAEYVFLVNQTRGAAYRPIIAGGRNIWMMHYWRNNCRLRDGELALFDVAPDLNNYTSDIGRMWPVNGTYSTVQRELYGFVIEHHKTLLSLIRPGVTAEAILTAAAAVLRPVAAAWPFSKPIYRAAAMRLLESKRPLSHCVGMAVHDAGSYTGRPLEVGTVFAVDPELVVPEEELYIRCEDTVAVTETGCENLTAAAPLEMDEVERVMRELGMVQQFPPAAGNGAV